MKDKVNIIWEYEGKTSFSAGTGATKAEFVINWVSSFIVPAVLLYLYIQENINWNVFQLSIILLLAFDISGGMVANSLNSCKRFYHTPVKPDESKMVAIVKNSKIFTALHIHTIIISVLLNYTILWGIFWYVFLNLSVWLIDSIKLYLRRPIAIGIIMVAILLNGYLLKSPMFIEWLVPMLFIKIVYGHTVREEPYRE